MAIPSLYRRDSAPQPIKHSTSVWVYYTIYSSFLQEKLSHWFKKISTNHNFQLDILFFLELYMLFPVLCALTHVYFPTIAQFFFAFKLLTLIKLFHPLFKPFIPWVKLANCTNFSPPSCFFTHSSIIYTKYHTIIS